MALFSAFTGKEAKEAAAKNEALYRQYQTEGLGELNRGFAGAQPAVQRAIEAYTPVAELGARYGQGFNTYMDALGLTGPEGTARARGAYQTSPGYDWATGEAIDRAQRAASRFTPGGNEIDAITRLSYNLGNQEYQKWLDRLAGLGAGQRELMTTAAGGQAAGQGAMAGLYSTDALNRVNLRGNVAGGIAGSNTAAANAAMAASGNFWNSLLGLGGAVAGGYFGAPRRQV